MTLEGFSYSHSANNIVSGQKEVKKFPFYKYYLPTGPATRNPLLRKTTCHSERPSSPGPQRRQRTRLIPSARLSSRVRVPHATEHTGQQNACLEQTNLPPVPTMVPSCYHAVEIAFNSQKQKPLGTKTNTNVKVTAP